MKSSLSITGLVLFIIVNTFPAVCKADMYKWRDADGVLHFSDVQPNQEKPFEKLATPKSPTSDIEIPQEGLIIKDIKMVWYLSHDAFQKEKIYHPQIEFVVQNNSNASINSLKAKFIFIENKKKVFGSTTEYIDDIPPGMISKTTFARPSMGKVYNKYNRSTILSKTFDVQMTMTLNGKIILEREFVFRSSTTK